MPISRSVRATRVEVYELPQTLVASVIHQGDYAGLGTRMWRCFEWIEANGYEPLGTYREMYSRKAPQETPAPA